MLKRTVHTMFDLQSISSEWFDELIRIRRWMHMHPELSGKEVNTSSFIYDELSTCRNLAVSRPCPTGVMAVLKGGKPGHVYAARADIDALPIEEGIESPYRSVNDGIMHACGHDGNASMLLTAAKILSRYQNEVRGTIKFLFQPCEEAAGGGSCEMIEAGCIDDIDYIIGQHVDCDTDPGVFQVGRGVTHASVYRLEIIVKGKGGHGGFPHQCTDTVNIAAEIICSLNTIIAKRIAPGKRAVLTITTVKASDAYNVIPDEVFLGGTMRTLDEDVEDTLVKAVTDISEGISKAHGAACEVRIEKDYSILQTDETVSSIVKEIIGSIAGRENVTDWKPVLGGEDFSLYAQQKKAAFFMTGTRTVDGGVVYPHHHSRFSINEKGLRYGLMAWLAILTQIEDKIRGKER